MDYQADIYPLNSKLYKLKEYGEYFYDHLILLCTDQAEKKYLKNKQILEFFDEGGNILFVGDIDTSKAFRILSNKLGINMEPMGSAVVDFSHRLSPHDKLLFEAENIIDHSHIFKGLSGPILYRGTGLKLS